MAVKVLIVDDDPITRQAIHIRLHAAGYETIMAADAMLAIPTVLRGHPNVILLDLSLPGGDGLDVLQTIKGMGVASAIPVIVISGHDPAEFEAKCLAAGAVAYMTKPFDGAKLVELVAKFSGKAGAPPVVKKNRKQRILVVEDDESSRQGISVRLEAAGYEVTAASDCVTATTIAVKEPPDLILLDLGLPGGDGLVLMKRFKVHPSLSVIPVVVLTGWDRSSYEGRAMEAGAAAFLQKPITAQILLDTINRVLNKQ